mgnify:CR=1 FL=1
MRGYQKKVIYLKNTGSSIFEEAYFIVKPEQKKKATTNEMVDEANRILEENYGKEKRVFCARTLRYVISFASGSIITLIFVLFFNLLCR